MAGPGDGGVLKRNYTTLHYLIHAPNFIRLFWRLFRDKRVSFLPRTVIALGLAYFAIPLDLVPEFPLVVVGYIDDIIVMVLALKAFIRLCPRNVVEEHVQLIDQGG